MRPIRAIRTSVLRLNTPLIAAALPWRWRRRWPPTNRPEIGRERGAKQRSPARSCTADRAAGPGARACAPDLGSDRADQSYSALRASRPRADLEYAGRRLGSAVAIASGHPGDDGGGLPARSLRRRRACASVQPVAPARIFALSLRRYSTGDANRRDRAAVADLSAATARR